MVCGRLSLARRHDRCGACGWAGYLADDYLGLDGPLSVGVRRLACLSASGSSFAVSTRHLKEYCGLDLNTDLVRRRCEKEAKAMGVWLDTQAVVAEEFAEAEGEAEFQTDAGKVNTTTGWRDLKVASLARRPLGPSAKPEEIKTRKLPEPSAKIVLSAITGIEDFIVLVEKQLDRLTIAAAAATAPTATAATTAPAAAGTEAPKDISTPAGLEFDGDEAWGAAEPVNCLGDGAGWIWRASQELFEKRREMLDFYHASDAVSKYTNRQYGDDPQTKKARYQRGVTLLLTAGDPGICQFLTEERQLLDATQKAANGLSATTLLLTMLLSGALLMPTSEPNVEDADATDAPASPTSPNAATATFPETVAPNVRSEELDDDDLDDKELAKALNSKNRRQRIDGLDRYFAKHANRLNYAARLREGRAIGSGMIEGNIKTITLRLKARGARWLVPNVVAMSRLCCLSHSTSWANYWQCPA